MTDNLGRTIMELYRRERYAWVKGRFVPWYKLVNVPWIGEWLVRCIGAPLNAKRLSSEGQRKAGGVVWAGGKREPR